MYFAISERGAAISRDIWHSYMIPPENRQRTAALDKGTNLSFALRYPPNQFRMPLKEQGSSAKTHVSRLLTSTLPAEHKFWASTAGRA